MSSPIIYHAHVSEAERSAKTEKEHQQALIQLRRDYREVFASYAGQRVLADMIRRSGLVQLSGGADPVWGEWKKGRKDLVLEVLNYVIRTPEELERLILTGDIGEVFATPAKEEIANDDASR